MGHQIRRRLGPRPAQRVLWAVAFAVAIVGGVALGAVPSRSVTIDQPVTVHGLLTYVWHGDPARGCAAVGVCGDQGSVVVRFDGFGDLTLNRRTAETDLFGASATARVRRDTPSATPGECVDAITVEDVGIVLRRVSGSRYIAGVDATPVSAGRCAGPLASELSKLRLTARRLPGHRIGFDLHGATSFAGGPFSGQLLSTVKLVPDTSAETINGGGTTGFESPPPQPRPVHHILVEFVSALYRVQGTLGTLTDTFSGAPQPSCAVLDNCGMTGSLTLGVTGLRSRLAVSGSRVVKRLVGRRQAIADLQHGVLNAFVPPLVTAARARLAEQLTQAGVGTCVDTVRSRPNLTIAGLGFGGSGQSTAVELTSPSDGTDALRTHCPGPSSAQVVGTTGGFDPFGGSPIAHGSIALSSLGSPRISLSLSDAGSFSGSGYSGTRSGSLGLTVTLVKLTAGTRHETVGG